MIPHFYQTIDGWFDFADIYDQAINEASPGAKLVEVGSWLGRSAAYMAVEIANCNKHVEFYCVDTWHGSPEHSDIVARHGGSMRALFDQHMAAGGVSQLVRPIECPSVEAAAAFGDGSLDFVFVDASHDFDSVCADISAWYPKVKPGGVIAGHDIEWAGLRPAVQARLPWNLVETRGSSWWHRKTPAITAFHEFDSTAAKVIRGEVASDHLLFIPVVNRLDLLANALASVPPSVHAIVVDQTSGDSEAIRTLLPAHIGYARPGRRLQFTELQNLMLRCAHEANLPYLLFMHADGSCAPHVIPQLLDRARQDPSPWGVLFTFYDILCAFHTARLMAHVGFWDETFRWYLADVDYYRRVRLAGLLTLDTGLAVDHVGSATIASDAAELAAVRAVARWHDAHYQHKWGGPPGRERHATPYRGVG